MNKEIQAKWIEMLRSGNDSQTFVRLVKQTNKGYAYCVIGLLGKACGFTDKELTTISKYNVIREKAELPDDKMWFVIHLNDDLRHSFEQIATYVESL